MPLFEKSKTTNQYVLHDLDNGPESLRTELPIKVNFLRMIAGPDRPDYSLFELDHSVEHQKDGETLTISHVVLAPRMVGQSIEANVENLGVGVAFVTDESLLEDKRLDFNKADYVAICFLTSA